MDPWAAPPEGAQAGQPGAPAPRPLPPAPPPPALRQPPESEQFRGTPRSSGRPGGGSGGSGNGGLGSGRRQGAPGASATARVGLILGLIGLLVVTDAGYGLTFGLGGAVLGVFALRDARAGRGSLQSALSALVVGLVVTTMALSLLALSMTKQVSDLQRCLDRAQTHEAADACRAANNGGTGIGGTG